MARRGRKAGYQNYGLKEQMLLVELVAKYKPIGRNVWDDVAVEYNLRRGRKWLERDFESLRRKFRSLYAKPKPTGINGDIPTKLRPIALAQEAQRAIELKGGSHTSHDGVDRGEDDALLMREVGAALQDEGGEDSTAELENRDSESDDEDDQEEESQTPMDDISQCAQRSPTSSQDLLGRSTGTIITSSGVFDASFATDVFSDSEEKRSVPDADHDTLPTDVNDEAGSSDEQPDVGGTVAVAITPLGAARRPTLAGTLTPTGSSTAKRKAVGRPKGGRKSPTTARPTYASPDGRPLARDTNRAEEDTQEGLRNQKKATIRNRFGGGDLRVLRDNMEKLTGITPSAGSKRDTSDISSTGATYASNKRARSKKRLDQLRKEMDEAEEKQSAGAVDMMQMLVFMREDAARRSETEDRRRREDRETRLTAERKEREERENLRHEESVAAEARRCQELEMTRAIREEQARKEAALAAESRLRYEEQLERDRAEARERHEQMLLLITAMQRGGSQPN